MTLEFPYPKIGSLIRSRRKQLDKTQQEIAAKLGISRASLANIENGRQRLLVHQLYGLASALELEILKLLPQQDKAAIPSDVSLPNDVNPKHLTDIKKIFG